MMFYKGNLLFLKQLQNLTIFAKLLLIGMAFSVLVLSASLFDVLIGFHFLTRLYLTIIFLLFSMILIYFAMRNLKRETLVKADFLARKNPHWLSYEPELLKDFDEKNIANYQVKNMDTGELKEIQDNFISDWQVRLNLLNKSLLGYFSLKSLIWLHLQKKHFWVAAILILILGFNLVNKVDSLRVLRWGYLPQLAEMDYSFHPAGGKFFFGEPLTIAFNIHNQQFRFLGFEQKKGDKDFQPLDLPILKNQKLNRFELRLASLTEDLQIRAVLADGLEILYSKAVLIQVLSPSHFKKIQFQITPPAYTGLPAFSSSENLLKVFYGSVIRANVTTDPDAHIFYRGAALTKKINKDHASFDHSFYFSAKEPMKISYDLKSTSEHSEVNLTSPIYELMPAEDLVPQIQIERMDTQEKLKFSEAGLVRFQFSAKDDFDLKQIGLMIISENRIIEDRQLFFGNMKKKHDDDQKFYQGEAQAKIPADKKNISLYLYAIDNSLQPSQIPFSGKKIIGQVGISNALQIEVAQGEEEKKNLEAKQDLALVEDLDSLQQDYKQSEKEYQDIVQSIRKQEDPKKIKQAIEEWKQRREALKNSLEKVEKAIEKNSKTNEDKERFHKEQAVKNIKETLSEDIKQRENELKKLMSNLPQDFVESSKQIKEMTQKQYMENLDNSIKQLKKMVAQKKVRELAQQIEKEINRLRQMQEKLLLKDQFSDAEKKEMQAQAKNHEENINKLQEQAKQLQKELREMLDQKQAQVEPKETSMKKWNKEQQKMQQNMQKCDNKNCQGEAISEMSQMQAALQEWQNDLEEQQKQMGQEDLKELVKQYQMAAFKINEAAQVWSDVQKKKFANPNEFNKNKLKEIGSAMSVIRESYKKIVDVVIAKAGKTGMLDPNLTMAMNETFDYFANLQQKLEADVTRPQDSNYHTVHHFSKNLARKFNQTSLALLKEMAKMKSQMAQLSMGGMGEQMESASQMQQDIEKSLEQLEQKKRSESPDSYRRKGENEKQADDSGENGKSGENKNKSEKEGKEGKNQGSGDNDGQSGLSQKEKEYLKELSRRQEELQKRLEKSGRELESESPENSKIAKERADALKKLQDQINKTNSHSDLTELKKDVKKEAEKFLNFKKSIKNKEEKNEERMAETSKEYYIKPPVNQLPEKKKRNLDVFDLSGYSEAQKIFFRNYIRGLENPQ